MKQIAVAIVVVLGCWLACGGQSRTVSVAPPARSAGFAAYNDAARGVSFRYSRAWSPAGGGLAGSFEGLTQVASFEFSQGDHAYADTNFGALVFSYFAGASSGPNACIQKAKMSVKEARGRIVHFNGVAFTEVHDASVGGGQEHESWIDATYRKGECLIFERVFHYANSTGYPDILSVSAREMKILKEKRKADNDPNADDEPLVRWLTASESKKLQRELNRVMQSVRLR